MAKSRTSGNSRLRYVKLGQVASALNEIERIADSNSADAVLRAELDVLTGELLDTMRSLVVDKISEAEAAGGSQRRINRANATLARGDQNRSIDWLRGANTSYGNAWAWAQSAL